MTLTTAVALFMAMLVLALIRGRAFLLLRRDPRLSGWGMVCLRLPVLSLVILFLLLLRSLE